MANITVSEALNALKVADPDELRAEIEIIEDEIAEYQRHIEERKNIVRCIKEMLIGNVTAIETFKHNSVEMPKKRAIPVNTPTLKRIIAHFEYYHNAPMTTCAIAEQIKSWPGCVGKTLAAHQGELFEQLDDLTWRMKAQNVNSTP